MAALAGACCAQAGPPFATDDPQPTDAGHYEVYFFGAGANGRAGSDGSAGIDFNYGARPGLQLTAVLPWEWSGAAGGPGHARGGGGELAAKARFLHDAANGLDAALFPRVHLPAAGEQPRHAWLELPVWLQWSGERWSQFGGGGCTLHPAGDAPESCTVGWAATRRLRDSLTMGAELVHSSRSGATPAATEPGLGFILDAGEHVHLLASVGPGWQGLAGNPRTHWYAALLATW